MHAWFMDAIAAGVAYVPGDRHRQGAVMTMHTEFKDAKRAARGEHVAVQRPPRAADEQRALILEVRATMAAFERARSAGSPRGSVPRRTRSRTSS